MFVTGWTIKQTVLATCVIQIRKQSYSGESIKSIFECPSLWITGLRVPFSAVDICVCFFSLLYYGPPQGLRYIKDLSFLFYIIICKQTVMLDSEIVGRGYLWIAGLGSILGEGHAVRCA